MNQKISKGIQLGVMALILAVLVVANIVCGIFSDLITLYLGGFGINTSSIDYTKSAKVGEDIEAEGIVLLKNENDVLPLENTTTLNVFGWSSVDFVYTGGGSGSSQSVGDAVKLFDALEEAGFECNTEIADKYKEYCASRSNSGNFGGSDYLTLIEPSANTVEGWITDEVKSFSDTALVVLSRLGGEHQDIPRTQTKSTGTDETRTYLDISEEEEGLIKLVGENFQNVIVLVNATNTMALGLLDDAKVDAVLNVGAVGEYGAHAIAKVLKGEINPSGKLADTYAYDFTTAPSYVSGPNGHDVNSEYGSIKNYSNNTESYYVDYNEGIYVGYKWYETAYNTGFWKSDFAQQKWGYTVDADSDDGYRKVVQYPFGYGLSYTEFEWQNVSIRTSGGSSSFSIDDEITVTLTVTNVGERAGKDVVQVYYEAPYTAGGIEKASKNLVAFAKTAELTPAGGEGTTQLVTLTFKASDMKSYDYNDANGNGFAGYEMERGDYTIYVATDAHTTVAAFTLSLAKSTKLETDEETGNKVENRFTYNEDLSSYPTEGVSSDGSDTEQNITWLTRAGFDGSFPEITTARRTMNFTANTAWGTNKDSDTAPTQGVAGDLGIYHDEVNAESGLTEWMPNLNLLTEIGTDYDNPLWDALLSQMSNNDLVTLVMQGGYRTARIDSISKPEFLDLDGPQGINDAIMVAPDVDKAKWTFFPSETVMAQTWSEQMAYTYGLCVGYEAYESKVSGWYAPACNLHRSPFGGRNFEYYSEDGFLSGMMAANTVQGAINNGLYCYVKHFAVNETSCIRSGGSIGLYTWVSEQAIRENYLKPFEIAVKVGGATAMMSAYSRIGNTWCGASYALLTQILRDEWGFKGSVVTDAYAITNTVYSMDQGLRAGNDMLLHSTRTSTIASGTFSDRTSTTALTCMREAAHNILYTYANTIARQDAYLNSDRSEEEARFATQISSMGVDSSAATWVWGLVALDVVGAVGLGVWTYFLFRKKKGKR